VRPLPPHTHAPAPIPPYYGGAAGDDFFVPGPASADLDGFAAALGGAPGFQPGILSPVALTPVARRWVRRRRGADAGATGRCGDAGRDEVATRPGAGPRATGQRDGAETKCGRDGGEGERRAETENGPAGLYSRGGSDGWQGRGSAWPRCAQG